jgi:hypothetical protein
VGCIYTAQGFEFDYIGVIFGKDLIYDFDEQDWVGRKQHSYDTVVKRSRDNFVDLVKNTYRVLLSRGLKGCYVCFLDKETERFFRSRMDITVETGRTKEFVPDELGGNEVLPFHYISPPEAKPFINCVPLFDLKFAAGIFSEERQVANDPEEIEFVKLPDVYRPDHNLFVAKVLGESMNRRIPNGSWCLFRSNPVGSRQGKIVLVQHREIQDADTGGHYTVKIYKSEKTTDGLEGWRHRKIVLHPESTDPNYKPIELTSDQAEDLKVIAELIAVLA